ncbi:hypothetical protein PSHT_03343 [Puccinia striiformis]|uniref:Secreted protein n=1 Tax=Puccinia striiformis TaxID=27350 RepID=A0A2S4WFV6_9BASI|nr:hypothetical protein PSHT_03343 [Puccinia striiformis]
MRFSSLLNICALLLLQSEAAYSTFVCTDNSKPGAKIGYCVRKIVNDDNYPDYGVILDGEDYIGIHVDHKGTGFSCAFAQIGAARSPVKRYCCGPNPTAGTSVYVWTHKELRDGCYSRDQDGGFH